jgi:hypothetical protein
VLKIRLGRRQLRFGRGQLRQQLAALDGAGVRKKLPELDVLLLALTGAAWFGEYPTRG